MQRRFENALAWILSEEDDEIRKSELERYAKHKHLYPDIVSFQYGGEKDQYSVMTAQILSSLGEQFPRDAIATAGKLPTIPIYVDVIQYRPVSNARVRAARTLQAYEPFDPDEFPELNAKAVYAGGAFWIILPEPLISTLNFFVLDAFHFEPFRSRLKMDNFTERQKLLLETAVVRLSVEAAIHHEMGHIRHGHSTFGNSEDHPIQGMSNWRLARELAADDFAAQSLTARAINNVFWSFPIPEEFLAIGPFASINALFLGMCCYFAVMAINLSDPKNQSPLVDQYPSVGGRMRYFYMTFSDTHQSYGAAWEKTGLGILTKLQFALNALDAYFRHLVVTDGVRYNSLRDVFAWVPNFGTRDVKFNEENVDGATVVTISDRDQGYLSRELAASNEAEKHLIDELQEACDLFGHYLPTWFEFSYMGRKSDHV